MLRYLLLDLDNTLYPESVGLEHDIVRRMNGFVSSLLKLEPKAAERVRREGTRHYGTTLEWLMAEQGFVDVEGYYAAVHPEGEEACIRPDPALGGILDSIPLPKAVFTNAPLEHAERVLARLGIGDRFEAIYDIRYNGLRGKPHAEAITKVCRACGVKPAEALFVDDMPKYVLGHIALGGPALLVDEMERHADLDVPRIRSLRELPGYIAGYENGRAGE